MHLTFWVYPLLFGVGVVTGLVDSMAGGGGVISLPVLLNLGMPVPLALGTNKLQASFGSLAATFHYARKGLIDFKAVRSGVLFTALGALAGASTIGVIDGQFLSRLIPWLLGAIVVYSILRPSVGNSDHPPRLRGGVFFPVFGLVLGFYGGFFGPGTGSFWTIALVTVQGFNFLKATAMTKLLNTTSNLAGLGFFLFAGQVDYAAGTAMGAGQVVGARLGTGLVFKKGARFIRPIFLTMVVLTVLRLVTITFTHPK